MSDAQTAPDVDIPTLALEHRGEIPVMGLGTWELEGDECTRIVRSALEMGYRHIDTAEVYENEENVGRGIEGWDREEFFLTSKVWRSHLRDGDLQEACRASLERLGTDYLDLYLVHWPDSSIPLRETIGALDELRDEGAIRAWGVSNFTIEHLEDTFEHGTPSVNQVEIHPWLAQAELSEFCREHGVVVTAYSPLAQGEGPGADRLEEIGESHDRSGAQVALRWSIQHGRVVIPKSSSEDHLAENLGALDFELSDEEMDEIDAMDEGRRLLEPDFAEFDR